MLKLLSLLMIVVSQAALAAEQPVIGSKSIEPLSTASLTQWTIGLIFVLLMILLVAWAVKRFSGLGVGHNAQLKVLSGVSLGTREKAVLVRAGKQYLLLGVAPGRVENLHTFAEGEISEDISQTANAPMGFQDSLQKMMKKTTAE